MLSLSLHTVDALRCSMKQSLNWSHGVIIWIDEMFDTCIVGDEHPGPVHSFKFRYMDDICSFLVVAHSLSRYVPPNFHSAPRRFKLERGLSRLG